MNGQPRHILRLPPERIFGRLARARPRHMHSRLPADVHGATSLGLLREGISMVRFPHRRPTERRPLRRLEPRIHGLARGRLAPPVGVVVRIASESTRDETLTWES